MWDTLFLLLASLYKREREKHRNQSNSPLENLGSDGRALRSKVSGILGPSSPLTDPGGGHAASFRPPRAPALAQALPSVVSVSVGWPPYFRGPGPAGICPPPLGPATPGTASCSQQPWKQTAGFESWFLASPRSASSPDELLLGGALMSPALRKADHGR